MIILKAFGIHELKNHHPASLSRGEEKRVTLAAVGDEVIAYLKSLGITTLDYLIATHPLGIYMSKFFCDFYRNRKKNLLWSKLDVTLF